MTLKDSAIVIPFPTPRRTTAADRHNARRRARSVLWSMPVPVPYLEWELVNYERPVVVKAWLALLTKLWLQGPIAGEPKKLAAAARLTPRMWGQLEPILASFFRRRSDGCWIHPILSPERDALLAQAEAEALGSMLQTDANAKSPGSLTSLDAERPRHG